MSRTLGARFESRLERARIIGRWDPGSYSRRLHIHLHSRHRSTRSNPHHPSCTERCFETHRSRHRSETFQCIRWRQAGRPGTGSLDHTSVRRSLTLVGRFPHPDIECQRYMPLHLVGNLRIAWCRRIVRYRQKGYRSDPCHMLHIETKDFLRMVRPGHRGRLAHLQWG